MDAVELGVIDGCHRVDAIAKDGQPRNALGLTRGGHDRAASTAACNGGDFLRHGGSSLGLAQD